MKEGFRNLWQLINSHIYTKTVSIVALFLIVAAVPLTVYISQQRQEIRQRASEPTPLSFPSLNADLPDKVIIKVGEENIYQKDFNFELSQYPTQITENENKIIVEKLIQDSVILQGAKDDGMIGVDNTTFNSLDKAYNKRLELVKQAKDTVENRADGFSGALVAIWFYNVRPGPIGYEKGKEIAYQKITKLHQDVISKKITIKQAGEAVSNDTSLAQLDPSYKTNAYLEFTVARQKLITFDLNADHALKTLKQGEVSPVITSQDKDQNGKMIDAVYSFGQMFQKTFQGGIVNFDSWLTQKRKSYEVKYF